MASIENRNGKYRIRFRYLGKPYARSIKTNREQKAELARGQIERNLELVSLGMLRVPPDCDVFDFLLTGTTLVKKTALPSETAKLKQPTIDPKDVSIGKVFELYFKDFLKESVEENSYATMQTHRANPWGQKTQPSCKFLRFAKILKFVLTDTLELFGSHSLPGEDVQIGAFCLDHLQAASRASPEHGLLKQLVERTFDTGRAGVVNSFD